MDEMAAMTEAMSAAHRSESDSWANRVRDLEVSVTQTGNPLPFGAPAIATCLCRQPGRDRARAAGAACIGTRSHQAAGTRLAGLPLWGLRYVNGGPLVTCVAFCDQEDAAETTERALEQRSGNTRFDPIPFRTFDNGPTDRLPLSFAGKSRR